MSDPNSTYLNEIFFDVGWVRYALPTVTHQACLQAHIQQTGCIAAQRLVVYAKYANPPCIRLK